MLLVEFYKGAPDLVRFQEAWNQEHTYLDKLKVRLLSTQVPCAPLLEDSSWRAAKNTLMGGLRKRFPHLSISAGNAVPQSLITRVGWESPSKWR